MSSFSRLDRVMSALDISALELSRHCGISSSLISRWRKSTRPVSERSSALFSACEALVALDTEHVLNELIEPFRADGMSCAEALHAYVCSTELTAMPPRSQPHELQHSGSYIAQQQVLLGNKGFRKAALLMMDYVLQLPPGQHVLVCAHNGFDLWLDDIPFAVQFLQKLSRAAKRNTAFLLINRRGFSLEGRAQFAGMWLAAHLKGIIRSRYYEGNAPEEYFVATIPGYWSGRAEYDETAEDGLISTLFTDARNIRKDESHCEEFIKKSQPASQYAFLLHPEGDRENECRWLPGPLPSWNNQSTLLSAPFPDGSFSAICSTPSFGVMTQDELASIQGKEMLSDFPDYLFPLKQDFEQGAYRIILCREDIREALRKTRYSCKPLNDLLGRKVFIPRNMLVAQLKRLLDALSCNSRFELALMPRSAFRKLEFEIVCWHHSASVGWLQDGSESVFANDPITSGNFFAATEYTWGKLHKGWKRKRNVSATVRKWLEGEELDAEEADSATVRNWEATSWIE